MNVFGTLRWYILVLSAKRHLNFSDLSQGFMVQKFIKHFYDHFRAWRLPGKKGFSRQLSSESTWSALVLSLSGVFTEHHEAKARWHCHWDHLLLSMRSYQFSLVRETALCNKDTERGVRGYELANHKELFGSLSFLFKNEGQREMVIENVLQSIFQLFYSILILLDCFNSSFFYPFLYLCKIGQFFLHCFVRILTSLEEEHCINVNRMLYLLIFKPILFQKYYIVAKTTQSFSWYVSHGTMYKISIIYFNQVFK